MVGFYAATARLAARVSWVRGLMDTRRRCKGSDWVNGEFSTVYLLVWVFYDESSTGVLNFVGMRGLKLSVFRILFRGRSRSYFDEVVGVRSNRRVVVAACGEVV